VLERVLDAASVTTLRSALSELQLAYAQAAEAPAAAEPSPPGQPPAAGPDAPAGGQGEAPKAPPQEQKSRIAPERPRIWTPGGDV
jgi:hypothetical protein